MKKTTSITICAAIVLMAGCQGQTNRAGEGAVLGGLLGATAGAIIGHQSGHGVEGAAIGAAAGVAAGAITGSQIQKQPAQTTAAQPVQQTANPNQMSIAQIADLSKQGVNEAVIIDKIRLTNSRYTLTAADINNLKQQGVSQNIINAMQGY